MILTYPKKKKMNTVLSLLDSGTSFELLAKKFSDTNPQGNKSRSGWILEDSLDDLTKSVLKDMNIGEIKKQTLKLTMV